MEQLGVAMIERREEDCVNQKTNDHEDVNDDPSELMQLAERICGSCIGKTAAHGMDLDEARQLEGTARLVAIAEEELRRRRLRTEFLPRHYFGEGAWAILLDLFVCQFRGRRVPVTSACIAAEVPATTALRWLDVLDQHGLIRRSDALDDKRVRFVTLTEQGYKAVESILSNY